ncbi:MAG: hypothetical protein ACREX0_15945 [Noviherbaspirillum sp.]
MLKSTRTAASLIALGVLLAGLSACQKKEVATEEKGPAEKAGQQIDQAAARASEEVSKAAEKAGKGLQELGQKLEKEAQEAQQAQKKE